jgi:hypothetical protein
MKDMKSRQITLPFRLKSAEPRRHPNADLIGRSYQEGDATITVIEACLNDDCRIIVQRDIDGRSWSMPAWLMRLIFLERGWKRAA